ncbi:MAG: phosphatase PAP2 family protein [Gammaproteobacteria bacterium]|jgi:undecaprenyl-diphosphatase
MAILLDKINSYDRLAFEWCLSRRYAPQVARVSRWISRLGDGVYYLIGGLLLLWLEPVYSWAFFTTALTGFAFELPLYLILKNSIKRQRPNDVISEFVAYLVPSDKFSFPSGHTAAAFVMATMVTYFYPAYAIPAYSLAALIGSSRVLLGVHFPTDILAGMALGLSSAMAALSLMGHI